jgi:hypothetical protein
MYWGWFWLSWAITGLVAELITLFRNPRGTLSVIARWALGIEPHKPWRYISVTVVYLGLAWLGAHLAFGWGMP